MTARRAATGLAAGAAAGLLFGDLGLEQALSYDGDRALVTLIVALAGAVVWLGRARVLLAGVLAMLAALWLVVAATPLSRALGRGLVRADVLAPSDAIFVLASSVQSDGDANASTFARLHHGIALARAGLAPRILVADVFGDPSHAEAARQMLRQIGVDVPVERVGRAANTHDEALAAAQTCRARGWRRVIVVTSPLHSRRAAATFERAGLEVISSPAVETRFNVEALLGADDRVEAFGEIVHERIGLLVYRWRGWI